MSDTGTSEGGAVRTSPSTDFTEEDVRLLESAKRTWQQIGRGSHLEEWLSLAPPAILLANEAMDFSGMKKRSGRVYSERFSMHLDTWLPEIDKQSVSCLLWLYEECNEEEVGFHEESVDKELRADGSGLRMRTLRILLERMSAGERARVNSPITAKRHVLVEAHMKDFEEEEEEFENEEDMAESHSRSKRRPRDDDDEPTPGGSGPETYSYIWPPRPDKLEEIADGMVRLDRDAAKQLADLIFDRTSKVIEASARNDEDAFLTVR